MYIYSAILTIIILLPLVILDPRILCLEFILINVPCTIDHTLRMRIGYIEGIIEVQLKKTSPTHMSFDRNLTVYYQFLIRPLQRSK